MYDRGRFFTITGNVLMGAPATVAPHEEAIRKLYLEINPPPKAKTTTRKPAEPSNLTDADLLRVMFNAKNGHKIRALWEGDSTGYASASEGDFALVSHFAFYTGGDERRIDSLFKQSGRCTEERAEKWERLGLDTIKKVVGGIGDAVADRAL
jgi:primase-polymerase (primpol)-like protein